MMHFSGVCSCATSMWCTSVFDMLLVVRHICVYIIYIYIYYIFFVVSLWWSHLVVVSEQYVHDVVFCVISTMSLVVAL